MSTHHSSDGHVSLYFDEIATVDWHLISEVQTESDRGGREAERETEEKREKENLFAITTPGPAGLSGPVRSPTPRSP